MSGSQTGAGSRTPIPSPEPCLDAWDEQASSASMQRWEEVCAREGWGQIPRDQALLKAVFGASWYLTRFLFYRGRSTALLLDRADADLDAAQLRRHLEAATLGRQLQDDSDLESLRVARNELLLQLLAADLRGQLKQEALEQRLTSLAMDCWKCLFDLHLGSEPSLARLVVLGMGRMAGMEMNYGSDLDLIFLYPDAHHASSSGLPDALARLLRRCAAFSPAGALYDIDTRLRPHGTAGTLVSSLDSFRRHHLQESETWERQVMTRCCLLQDPEGLAAPVLEEIRAAVFRRRDPARLRTEIATLRGRVQRQLGNPRGRCELKRGPGGIMDIDFITHELQLEHGMEYPQLQALGTRSVLRQAAELSLVETSRAQQLLDCYDFLKRIEGRCRLFDLKAVSSFPRQAESLHALARGCGLRAGGNSFLQQYDHITQQVRTHFQALVGEIP